MELITLFFCSMIVMIPVLYLCIRFMERSEKKARQIFLDRGKIFLGVERTNNQYVYAWVSENKEIKTLHINDYNYLAVRAINAFLYETPEKAKSEILTKLHAIHNELWIYPEVDVISPPTRKQVKRIFEYNKN
jgi:hypothetical protein